MMNLIVFGFAVFCLTVLVWNIANIISDLVVKSTRSVKLIQKRIRKK